MSKSDSTTRRFTDKPNKPDPEFPLFPHATRRWAKKINGRMHYFGSWDDPKGALQNYQNFVDGKTKPKPKPKTKALTTKPSKPHPDFPLFPHDTKRWAKKIRSMMHYFGSWDDPDGALKSYLEHKDALHAGRKPKEVSTGVTVKDMCNAFLNHKKALQDAGELSPRTWRNCEEATIVLVSRLGKSWLIVDLGQDDFADLRKWMAKKWGPVRLGDFIQRIRCVFKHAYDSELLAAPIRYGPGLARPTKKTIRLSRAKRGLKMFEAEEIRAMVEGKNIATEDGERRVKPTTALKAMILLGINCGYGNSDCGTLPLSALDLERGWINYHRPKTGITRRNSLWPETVEALRVVLAQRKEPKDAAHADLVFITKRSGSFLKADDWNPIASEMRKHLKALGITDHRTFYALRHTFKTIGGEAKDQVAVDALMGHTRDDMASVYRERISDERLKAVSDHVRKWVFGEGVVAVG
jgi:integrase